MIALNYERKGAEGEGFIPNLGGKSCPMRNNNFIDIFAFIFVERLYFVLCLYTTIFKKIEVIGVSELEYLVWVLNFCQE